MEGKTSARELALVEGKVSSMIIDNGYELSAVTPVRPGKFELLGLALGNKLHRFKFGINRFRLLLYSAYFFSKRVGWTSCREYCGKKMNEIKIRGLK